MHLCEIMPHPLTDEICDQIQDSVHPCDPANMRIAADWQLEQVIKWAQRNCWCWFEKPSTKKSFTKELKKAMRPQQQKDN
jgi:hypothetical protein